MIIPNEYSFENIQKSLGESIISNLRKVIINNGVDEGRIFIIKKTGDFATSIYFVTKFNEIDTEMVAFREMLPMPISE